MVMNGKTTKFIVLTAALAFLATTALVPTASAQPLPACTNGLPVTSNIVVGVTDKTEGTVTPITGSGKFEVSMTMSWDQGGKSASALNVFYEATTDKAGFATVTLERYSFSETPKNDATKIQDTVKGQIFLSKDAPAFSKVTVTVTAKSPGGTCIAAPEDGDGKATMIAGFYGKMVARLDSTIQNAGQNAKVTLPLIVENFGNGDIEVSFKMLDREKQQLDVIEPSPVIVPSAVGSTQEALKQINIDVKTPYKNGYMNKPFTVVFELSSISTDQRDIEGPSAQVSALIQTQGVYVPGFELTTLLAAGLAALVGMLRRR